MLLLLPVFLSCSPTAETSRKLTVDEMYLVDSGGQYLWVKSRSAYRLSSFTSRHLHLKWVILSLATTRDGTTDITRTVHWGTPTALERVILIIYIERVNAFSLSKHKRGLIIHMAVYQWSFLYLSSAAVPIGIFLYWHYYSNQKLLALKSLL